jgi:hypothetical protein
MEFIQLWFTGYVSPVRFIERLRGKPAPLWGFCGQLLRALMDALLLFLPAYLLGRTPPMESFLTLFPTKTYYATLVWLAPLVFFIQWLVGSGMMHVALRLMKRPSDIDLILNISGMTTLVVGFILLVWDWSWIALGGMDQYTLGISHLVIDIYGIAIGVIGLKRLLGVPIWLGILLHLLIFIITLPIAALFIRSPL